MQRVNASRSFDAEAARGTTIIPRIDTTNLSNMPVISKVAHKPGTGTGDYGDAALAETNLSTDERNKDEWKIIKFSTTGIPELYAYPKVQIH